MNFIDSAPRSLIRGVGSKHGFYVSVEEALGDIVNPTKSLDQCPHHLGSTALHPPAIIYSTNLALVIVQGGLAAVGL